MGLGEIIVLGETVAKPEGTENVNGVEPLLGNKRVLKFMLEGDYERRVVKDQEELPK